MTTGKLLNVLSLEDSVQDYEIICEQLIETGYALNISRVEREAEFVSSLHGTTYDIILADFSLPGFDAFKALRLSLEICPEVPFICVSGFIGEETAIELIKQGAEDYVLKDRLGRLPSAIKRALDNADEKNARWKANQALRESEHNYRTLADSGQTLIWTSGTDKRCNYVNRLWLGYTGFKPGDDLGEAWIQCIHPDDLQPCLSVYHDAFSRREKYSIEYRLKQYDGEYRWFQDHGSPRFSAQNEFIGYIGQCQDITGRKESELLLKSKNEELQMLNSQKDKFFSIIAHDLRSPFNSFLGLTQIMAEELPGLTMDEIQKIAVSLNKSAVNLFRLLENLLEWSRIQLGTFLVNRKPLLLRPLVAESLAMVMEPAKIKGIHIAIQIPDKTTVFADSNIVQTVIRNLVSNALKFTSRGGSVKVAVSPHINDQLLLSVTDTGIGMNSAMLGNLFRLDVQNTRNGTEGEPSSGLGLLICKDLIEKQGGAIWAESEEGKGSTFWFTIQVLAPNEEDHTSAGSVPAADAKQTARKLKIVIAEDDETSAMLISMAVNKFSSETLTVSTGLQAVEACRSNPDVDLVMMDVKMPGMDGYQATSIIRQFNRHVVIIAQTAYGLPDDKQKAIEAGCDDYISKPINIASLKGLIQKYFNPQLG